VISRTLAGVLLGYLLAAALGSLWTRAAPGALDANLVLAMVLFVPLWLAAWTWAYLARSAWRACWTLGTVVVLAHVVLWLLPDPSLA
jgi:hypothetical protein